MKKYIALAGVMLMILSFQNCAQRNVALDSSADSAASGIGMDVTPAKNLNKVVIWNPDKQQYIDVSLETGKMVAFEEFGQVRGDKFCLTQSELSELQTILQNSSICEPKVSLEAAKDQVCTEIYKYPYASLVQGSREFRLGEMNSGCDKPVDLCGDNAAMLKNFSTAILKNLESRACQ